MPKKIFIGGLSVTAAADASLQQMLSPFGTVLSVELLDDDQAATAGTEVRAFGQTQGVAVTFVDDAAGDRAIQDLNGAVVDGASLTVAPYDGEPQ